MDLWNVKNLEAPSIKTYKGIYNETGIIDNFLKTLTFLFINKS